MYFNPVIIKETSNWRSECIASQEILGIQNPLIITSRGNKKRLELTGFFLSNFIFTESGSNPTFEICQKVLDECLKKKFDGIIAIGGGSVMDTAKVVLAGVGTGIDKVKLLLNAKTEFKYKIPSIFIPTNHGSGSEVTMWATIWDDVKKRKYSLSHNELYPDIAILDGALTLSLPLELSIISVLDALSHSFEAIWNKNANQQSTDYAVKAIILILQETNNLEKNLNNLQVRNNLLKGSNTAGLAFSNTKTAAAHSISYPLTSHYGIPHGLAASISLEHLLLINREYISGVLDNIISELSLNKMEDIITRIKSLFLQLSKPNLRAWGVKSTNLSWLVSQCFTEGRMDNNIIDLSEELVLSILKRIY